MTISSRITRNFPITEGKLAASSEIDYASLKDDAITDAKRALYGDGVTVPSESDIPDVAQSWIADKATLLLIPVAIDFYMQTVTSISKEGATTSYHDKVAALRALERELKATLAENLEKAKDAIDAADAPEQTDAAPAVSVDGLLVDATVRAFYRGAF